MMTAFVTLFDGFVAKKGDNNCRHLFRWFCCEKSDGNIAIAFFYGGGVVKKAVVTYNFLISFFLFLFLWSFWSISLELTINNEMVVFLNVEGCNG